MVIDKSNKGISSGPSANQYEFFTSTVCKNVVEKFVTIALFLKELIILLKESKV